MKKSDLRAIMQMAWQFVKRNGFTMAEALKTAWLNYKLKMAMMAKIVKFYFQKVDGTIREAYGTLRNDLMPEISGNDARKKNALYRCTTTQRGKNFAVLSVQIS